MEKTKINKITKLMIMIGMFLMFSIGGYSVGGTGTINSPLIINTCVELGTMSVANSNLYYKLGNNIDCSATTWTPLINFYNQLDGQNFTINNLNNRFISNLQGNGVIKNIKFNNMSSTGFGTYYGLAVGRNYGMVNNIHISNSSMEALSQSGLLVGRNDASGKIYYSSVDSSTILTNVATSTYIGGFIGYQATGGIIHESKYTGTSLIQGLTYVGGFIGMNVGYIYDSYSKTNVNGGNFVGGFVGHNNAGNARIYDSYSISHSTGTSNVHSFAGYTNGVISNSFYDNQVGLDSSNYGSTGLTSLQMQDIKKFSASTNWDFTNIWYHNSITGLMDLRIINNVIYNKVNMIGTGIALDPFQITTCNQIYDISNNPLVLSSYFKLMNNIDCNNIPMKPIGVTFLGNFNGNNKIINNTYIELFNDIGFGAKVYNLSITNADLNDKHINQGILSSRNSGEIRNVRTTGKITSSFDQVGGLVGWNLNLGKIYSSSSNATLISSANFVGGLVGRNAGGGNIFYSYSDSPSIVGGQYVGGLIGYQNNGGITYESKSILSSVTGNGANYVGGFIGMNIGYIYDSYSTSNSIGTNFVGGFVGHNNAGTARIYNSYSTGTASGTTNVHGFAGYTSGTISNSFYDIQTSGDTSNYGVTGLTTINMKNINSFSGYVNWDLQNKWFFSQSLNNGYPSLRQINNQLWVVPTMNGTGILGNEYQITDCKQLYVIDRNVNYYNSKFKLMNNISCSGITQTPIGGTFQGDFNGQGHTISQTSVSLFDTIGNLGNVHDLKIEGAVLSDNIGNVGILSKNNYGIIRNVFTNGVITSNGQFLGGLTGRNWASGKIYNSYSFADIIGSITTSTFVGGLVGYQDAGGYIYDSYSFNNQIQGFNQVGGFIGGNIGYIYDSYSTSPNIIGNQYVGGFVGYQNTGKIYNAYSTGIPTGSLNVGGFSGYSAGYGMVLSQTFWDKTTSGTSISSGVSIGKFDTQMKSIQTYSGSNNWDFINHWYMDNVTGFPKLRIINNNFYTIPLMIGDGSPLNPFQITTCNQINNVKNNPTSNYILMNNIFCDNVGVQSIPTFSGVFEGNNKIISGTYVPLFVTLTGNVKNFGITNHINSEDYNYYGVLARYNDGGIIQNVYTSGTISTKSTYVGGLVGRNNVGGSIQDSESYVNIYGSPTLSDYVGGLVGISQGNSFIYRSSSKGNTLIGHNYIGGLTGMMQGAKFYDSYTKGMSITGFSSVGGLIGYYYVHPSYQSWVYNSYASDTLTSTTGTLIGGIFGQSYINNYAYGNLVNTYYDKNTTGLISGGGVQNIGVGLTSSQMINQTSFVGYDFATIWKMDNISNNGFPNQQSVIPLVVNPFNVFINYPLNNEIININNSVTPITLNYVHNSNSTNVVCKQYLDGVLIDTRYNVGQGVQTLTLNRWLGKQYLYEVKCSDSILNVVQQHLFNVNVAVDLLGYNPNTNSSFGVNPIGGTQNPNINITAILNAINSLNLTVVTTQGQTIINNITNNITTTYTTTNNINNGTNIASTKIYHSYPNGYKSSSANYGILSKEFYQPLNNTAIINPITNGTLNTTNKTVIDVTKLYNTFTFQNGTQFENVRPTRLYDNVLSRPVLSSQKLGLDPNSNISKVLDNYFPNWVLLLLISTITTMGLWSMEFARKHEKLKRFKLKTLAVGFISSIMIYIIYLFIGYFKL